MEQADQHLTRWQAWLAECEKLSADILERRGGEPLDMEALWRAARADLEARDDSISNHQSLSPHTSKYKPTS
jgi:hypothetical protein